MNNLNQLELFEYSFEDNRELELVIKKLPKIDLHTHLSGCLRMNTVREIINEYNLKVPQSVSRDLRRSIVIDAPVKRYSDFFLPWRRVLNKVTKIALENPQKYSQFVLEMAEDFSNDGVVYAEVRISIRETGINDSIENLLNFLKNAFTEAYNKFGIVLRGILGFTRNSFYQLSESDRMQITRNIVQLSQPFRGNTIVGFDLWGNEKRHPPKAFAKEFQIIRDAGFPVTVHAGEIYSSTFIRDSVNILKAKRLGHATAISKDLKLFDLLRDNQILVEVCLTSNVKSSIVKNISEHPVRKMIKEDIPISLCADNTTVLNTTLSKEISRALLHKLVDPDYLQKMYANALKKSFLPKTDIYYRLEKKIETYNRDINNKISELCLKK